MSRGTRVVSLGSVTLFVAAGVACAVLVSGVLGAVLAFVLIAMGLTLGTSLIFLAVGLSEDRARAAEALGREAAVPRGAPPRVGARPRYHPERAHRRRLG